MTLHTTLSTLLSLGFYTALVAAGAAAGSRRRVREAELPWLNGLQRLNLMVLITALGVQLGANDEVVASLGQIGLSALVITLLSMAGSVACVFLLRRFVLKLDRRGRPASGGAAEDEAAQGGGKADNSLTKWIIAAVAVGMLAGRFLIPPALSDHCGTVIDIGLYLILFLVGLDMGRQGGVLADIRAAGLRVLLVPLAVAVGSLACAMLAGLFLPMGVKDSAAAASGFGWYSLAPTLLAPYSLSVSAVAFLSNVLREVLSIIAVPLVARYVGYVECVALPGAAAMDTVLPVVVGATHERITIYSFASGVILSLAVPVLVPAIAGL